MATKVTGKNVKNGSLTDADALDGRDATAFGSAAKTARAGFGLIDHDTACVAGIAPTVTVDVGSSGLVAVYVEANVAAPGLGPASSVYLYEPTDLPACARLLRSTNTGGEVRKTLPGSDVGTTGPGSWLIFHATPGTRAYSLRYGSEGGAGGTFGFATGKVLTVVPL